MALLWVATHVDRFRPPLLRAMDVGAPSVVLGEGITRIGCFLNGCCHGVVCALPWGVRFPAGSPAHALFGDAVVHPSQLYASLGSFGLFFALSAWLRRRPFDGAVAAAWLVGASALRMVVDLSRHYEEGVTLFHVGAVPFTVNTAAAVALLLAGVFLWTRGSR